VVVVLGLATAFAAGMLWANVTDDLDEHPGSPAC
jgi:hypothetical protein